MDNKKYTIFVVEDETQILRNTVKKIEQLNVGFEVAEMAKNGQQAIDLLQKQLPDVIITDIRMPQVDGLQLVQHLSVNCPSVRTVIISGYSDFEYARKAIQLNVKEYLLKPVESEQLYQCLIRLRIELDAEHDSIVEKMKVLKATQGESIEDTIEKLRLYMDNNFTDEIKLGEIAQGLNFNSSYLCKWFVKIVGETPSSYIIKLRISKAKHLLQSVQELSVKEIGELVGYADQNYFSRIFKAQAGISPAHYRDGFDQKTS
jgi:two-component system response regulator YesN